MDVQVMRSAAAKPALFSGPGARYQADTCDPLRRASQRGDVRFQALCHRGYPGTPLPPKMLPELSSVGFWDVPAPQGWGLDWHRNEGIELTYLASGKLDYAVDGREYSLENGSLTITRPWQQHRVGNPCIKASRLHWLILDVGVRRPDETWQWPSWFVLSPKDLRRLTTLLRHNETPVWQADAAIAECFSRVTALTSSKSPADIQTRLQLHINHLFVALLDLLQKRAVVLDARLASTRRTVEMFLASLAQHLDQTWDLESMARQCGLGRSRFTEYCRQITNLTPIEYLTQSRLEAAKQMLIAQPVLPITEIALTCGFQSSQYFATVFHQKMGCSPRDFRSEHGSRANWDLGTA